MTFLAYLQGIETKKLILFEYDWMPFLAYLQGIETGEQAETSNNKEFVFSVPTRD